MEDMTFDDPVEYTTNVTTTRKAWVFDTTGGAYNTTQVDDNIKDGDVLLVPSEKVAGFLDKAWPTAVTEESGDFHRYPDGLPEHLTLSAELAADVWNEYQDRNGT